jgi:hypothetical protein
VIGSELEANLESGPDDLLTRMRADSANSRERGEAWIKELSQELKNLPRGTVIVINCDTGEYVSAASRLDALRKFQERFGNIPGWMHEIGGGLFVGGGIV